MAQWIPDIQGNLVNLEHAESLSIFLDKGNIVIEAVVKTGKYPCARIPVITGEDAAELLRKMQFQIREELSKHNVVDIERALRGARMPRQ